MLCKLVVVLLVALCSVAKASDVVVLTQDNFDESLASGVWFIEFYAPWCGHCKRLAPTWEELATNLKGEVNIAKVDCTIEKDLAQKYGIRGFPTLKLIDGSKVYDFAQKRTIEAFTAFAQGGYKSVPAQSAPGVKREEPTATGSGEEVVILDDSNFGETTAEGIWLVKFYAPWCGHCKKLAPVWDTLATNTEGKFQVAKIDCTTSRDTCSAFGVRGYPTLKLLKDGKQYAYSGARTEENFKKFVETGHQSADVSDLPALAGAPPKVAKQEKAAPAGTPSSGEVVVLTEANFAQHTASGKWLIEFYAPWCGHCKRLAPTWDKLATESGSVNIAKVDCTVEKDLAKQFGIRGFPTIKLIEGDKFYDFKGARTIESFLSFAKDGYKEADVHDVN